MTEETIFAAALEKPDPAERSAFLDDACRDDPDLRKRLDGLLAAHDKAGGFLNSPVAGPFDPDAGPTRTLPPAGDGPTLGHGDGTDDDTDDALGFLSPPGRPDSLGRLGHYEVLEVLGRGGFGVVFRAFDEVLQRVVAVKVLAPSLAATSPARKRFLREARSAAPIQHENVVRIHETGEEPLPFLVMEFVPGETLQQRLDRTGPLEVSEAVRIARQVAGGLAAAHEKGLIHRDIKPSNILIDAGPQQQVKITDFGLARAADDASLTRSGVVAGTPMYMAPEQAKGESLDHRADLFSLGSVLYAMLTGRPPFRATTTFAVLKRVAEDNPRPIREVIPEVPEWLCRVVEKLHAKDPAERFQTAREVADLLADCEKQLAAHKELTDFSRIPGGRPRPRRRFARKWKWAAAVVVLLLPLAAWGVYHLTRPVQRVEDAPRSADPVKEPAPDAVGWVQLFNGRDLTGWQTVPGAPANWTVVNGVLTGRGPVENYLYSSRGDYRDFHLRAEARISERGNSGIHFRVRIPGVEQRGAPDGYEVQIAGPAGDRNATGSLMIFPARQFMLARVSVPPVAADTWFTQEIIARRYHITIKVNGKVLVDHEDVGPEEGHLALQAFDAHTRVQFRKIEIKEVPPAEPATPPPAVAPFDAAKAKQHQEVWAKHLGVAVETTNSVGGKMVLIPPGIFLMGSPENEPGRKPGETRHEVAITKPFYLGAHPVTVGQFKAFVMDSGYKTAAEKDGGAWVVSRNGWKYDTEANWQNPRFDQTDGCPVVCLDRDDTNAFCAWLTRKEGRPYTLPTEAQWEYACRAGTQTAFSFGNDKDHLPEHAWVAGVTGWETGNAEWRTHPVGEKRPNAWGVFEMHGNIRNWTDDWYREDYYAVSPRDDPTGPAGGTTRVVRGGAWYALADTCRSAYRHGTNPTLRFATDGFRVVVGGDLKPRAPPAVAPLDLRKAAGHRQ